MKPLKFQPLLKSTIWGGSKIIAFKHLDVKQEKVGESWEISGVPGKESIVADGEMQGKSLNEVVKELKGSFLGEENYKRFGNEFPLLIKFIDANSDLSIQVHPNDEIAHKQGKERGKTEMWEKPIEDFIEWSVKYDLWCKMRFFGNQMQEAIDADSRMVYHATGVSNLLLYVHDTFDKVEIQRVCQIHGTKTKLAILLCNWKKRGFIVKNEDGTFSKTAKFIGKYGHYGTPGMAA